MKTALKRQEAILKNCSHVGYNHLADKTLFFNGKLTKKIKILIVEAFVA